jgi:hypothetical protein
LDPRLCTASRLSGSGSSQRLDQTAIEGPNRLALVERTAARKFPGALETLAFPAAAFQNDRLTLRKAGPVGCRRDAHGGAVEQLPSVAGATAITTSVPMTLRFRGAPAERRSCWRHGSGVPQQGGVLTSCRARACQSLAAIGKLAATGWRFGSNSHSCSPGPAVQFNWGLCCVLRPDPIARGASHCRRSTQHSFINVRQCGSRMKTVWTFLGGLGFLGGAAFLVFGLLAWTGLLPPGEPLAISGGVMLLVSGLFCLRAAADKTAEAARGKWARSNVKVGRLSEFAFGVGFCSIGAVFLGSNRLPGWFGIAPFVLYVASWALAWIGAILDRRRARTDDASQHPDQNAEPIYGQPSP